MRRQIGSVTTGHSPDKNQRSRDFRKRNGIVSGCYAPLVTCLAMCACWSIGKQHTPHSLRDAIWHPLLWERVAEDKLHRIPFGYFVIRRNRRKSGIDRRTGKGGVAAEQRISELTAGNAGSGQRTMDTMEPAQTPAEIRDTLEVGGKAA